MKRYGMIQRHDRLCLNLFIVHPPIYNQIQCKSKHVKKLRKEQFVEVNMGVLNGDGTTYRKESTTEWETT